MKRSVFSLLLASVWLLAGCSKDSVELVDVTLKVTLPADEIITPQTLSGDPAVGFDVTFTNTSSLDETKVQTDAQGIAKAQLEQGVYSISVYGTYKANGKEMIYQSNVTSQSISLPTEGNSITLPEVTPELATVSGGWVIKEIYFSGTRTQANKAYYGDQYITLYNNSDQVLYADGLCISQTAQYTTGTSEQTYYSQFLPGAVLADLILQVPGTGKQYPVQPGECFVVANQGLDHTKLANSKADMSKADFEWVDEGTSLDVDVPEVPNMKTLYGYSKTINIFSVQGNRSFFIYQPEGDIDAFLNAAKVTVIMPAGTSKEMFAIPSNTIIDGVQCAFKNGLKFPSVSSSVDLGFTYVGEVEGDSGSYSGLVVTRKVKEKAADGRYILQDTNNSTNDFLPNQEPSPYEVKE